MLITALSCALIFYNAYYHLKTWNKIPEVPTREVTASKILQAIYGLTMCTTSLLYLLGFIEENIWYNAQSIPTGYIVFLMIIDKNFNLLSLSYIIILNYHLLYTCPLHPVKSATMHIGEFIMIINTQIYFLLHEKNRDVKKINFYNAICIIFFFIFKVFITFLWFIYEYDNLGYLARLSILYIWIRNVNKFIKCIYS